MLNGLFVDRRNERALNDVYERFTRLRVPFREIAYRGKQLILRVSMASELNVLAHRLNRFSETQPPLPRLHAQQPDARRCARSSPASRSTAPTSTSARRRCSARDRPYHRARRARGASGATRTGPAAVFDFVRDLLLKKADYIPETERDEHLRFVGKFQQVTSPVTAKGIEDTALYIYNRLVSLNEVGGEPDHFGIAPADAARVAGRARAPLAARAVGHLHARHQAQRGRARAARTCCPSCRERLEAGDVTLGARQPPRPRRVVDGQSYPSRNEEYLLYQTLVGSWPLDADGRRRRSRPIATRIVAYMLKAMREAKVFTSWLNPSETHEAAMTQFVEAMLAPDEQRLPRRLPRRSAGRVATAGLYNSLAQVADQDRAPPACPTSTRAPSSGTSASSTRTTAGRSTTRRRRQLLRGSRSRTRSRWARQR